MDPELFLELANQVTKLKMYPYFDISHCVISCLYMREDLSAGESLDTEYCLLLMLTSNTYRKHTVFETTSVRLLGLMHV